MENEYLNTFAVISFKSDLSNTKRTIYEYYIDDINELTPSITINTENGISINSNNNAINFVYPLSNRFYLFFNSNDNTFKITNTSIIDEEISNLFDNVFGPYDSMQDLIKATDFLGISSKIHGLL